MSAEFDQKAGRHWSKRALRAVWRRFTVSGPEDELFNRLPMADGFPVIRGRMNDEQPRMPRRTCSTDEFERHEEQ